MCIALFSWNSMTKRSSSSKAAKEFPKVWKGYAPHVFLCIFVDLSAEILTPLAAGKYYLRLHISWVNEKELNSGNLVVYSSPKNI